MRSATERLQRAIAALPAPHTSFAVLRIGMDGFRLLNQTLGHAVGDEVLALTEQRLRAAIREHEVVHRLPGDEFAVLLHPVTSVLRAGAAADRLNAVLQRTCLALGEAVNVTASIGVALAPEDGTAADLLLQRAGAALHCAKDAGVGTVQFFEPAMEGHRKQRHSLSLDLRKALPLQQLEVHYQPQIHIGTQALTGFEALLRWRHPDLGWIPPAQFLPLAQEDGLMADIGDWAIRSVCKQARKLPTHLSVAINALPVQFTAGGFAQSVEAALQDAGLTPNRLEIEITEALLLRYETPVSAAAHRLHQAGVRLVLDHFGAGLASLGQIGNLPFSKIKIDPSLAGGTIRQRSIVRALNTLAEGLGMQTLAEGVESEAHFAHAASDGCGSVQGTLFGKPLQPQQLTHVLQRSPATHDRHFAQKG